MNNAPCEPLRPRDLALVLLASRDLRPRQRARDQQADLAGLALKRSVLEKVAALDPEPDALEATLAQIVDTLGPPLGPARAIATLVRDEWLMACAAPEWVAQLLAEALETPPESKSNSRG
jgi:hypothetical protein